MTDSSASRRRGLVLALLLLFAAVLVYWGVTRTARDARRVPRPLSSDPLRGEPFHPWDSLTLATAQSQNRLIILLVTDTRSKASREWTALIAQNSGWLGTGTVAVTVDRRLRPDVALRYANEAAPFALLLLPTGEALATLEGMPSVWPETIAEVDRYWREHPEEIRKRVVDFWAEEESRAAAARLPRAPAEADLAVIDRAVREFLTQVLTEPDSNAGIWRIDISTYLAARAKSSRWAESLQVALFAARAEHWPQLFDSVVAHVPPFGVAQLAEEQLGVLEGGPDARARASGAAAWMAALDPPSTAAEIAALHLLRRALGEPDTAIAYPGSWLGFEAEAPQALPHVAGSDAALDGYLVDALLWLELLTHGTTDRELAGAERLADSLWSNLWTPEAHALRDKPLRPMYVREIARYPRAQLGKAALLLHELHARTGQARFGAWADSCLAGFAPYAADAGSASAYYGAAALAASRRAR